MAKSKRTNSLRPRSSRRTGIVWGSFVAAVTVVSGVLALSGGANRTGFPAVSLTTLSSAPAADLIVAPDQPLDRERWTSIVIHHSGSPAGDPQSLTRQHVSQGLKGLGFHFVIGNGNGLGDGVVHVGHRWLQQLPGAHTTGPQGNHYNQHAIGICLIGNGDRRPFTDAQIDELVSVVKRLQREFQIPASAVLLHGDVAPGVTSPGRLFPAAQLREQLLR